MAKSNSKIKVSIIILTINSKNMLLNMLENVSKLQTFDLEATCIVVDNGSTDGTKDIATNYKVPNMKYKFIETGKNLGFAGGNNVGIRQSLKSKSDYTVIVNDDVVMQKDFLLKMVKFMEENPKTGIASPKIYFTKDGKEVIWYAGGNIDWNNIYASHRGVDEVDNGQYNKSISTDSASGACMIINNGVFKKVGLLDEGFYLYWEDADFSQRVKRSGFEVVYAPVTYIWHKVSASGGGIGSKSNDYFLVRNRLSFAFRYAKPRTKFAVLRDTIRLSLFGRGWQKLGALHALIGKKGAGPWVKS